MRKKDLQEKQTMAGNRVYYSLAGGVVFALLYYSYKKKSSFEQAQAQGLATVELPSMEGTMFVFAAGFGLVYLSLYSMEDPKSSAMNEIDLNDPDF
jgi:hypothetical protein